MTLHPTGSPARLASLALALPLTLVSLATVGCRSTEHGGGAASPPKTIEAARLAQLVGTAWTCTQLAQGSIPAGVVPTLAFAGTEGDGDNVQVSGFAGVNRYFGPVKETNGALAFGPLAATRMAGPPDRMELERAYLDMLAKADSAHMDGDTLQLVDDGAVLATFTRAVK